MSSSAFAFSATIGIILLLVQSIGITSSDALVLNDTQMLEIFDHDNDNFFRKETKYFL